MLSTAEDAAGFVMLTCSPPASPIQPSWIPPNCKFEVDDAETDWTYPSDSFDLIQPERLPSRW